MIFRNVNWDFTLVGRKNYLYVSYDNDMVINISIKYEC